MAHYNEQQLAALRQVRPGWRVMSAGGRRKAIIVKQGGIWKAAAIARLAPNGREIGFRKLVIAPTREEALNLVSIQPRGLMEFIYRITAEGTLVTLREPPPAGEPATPAVVSAVQADGAVRLLPQSEMNGNIREAATRFVENLRDAAVTAAIQSVGAELTSELDADYEGPAPAGPRQPAPRRPSLLGDTSRYPNIEPIRIRDADRAASRNEAAQDAWRAEVDAATRTLAERYGVPIVPDQVQDAQRAEVDAARRTLAEHFGVPADQVRIPIPTPTFPADVLQAIERTSQRIFESGGRPPNAIVLPPASPALNSLNAQEINNGANGSDMIGEPEPPLECTCDLCVRSRARDARERGEAPRRPPAPPGYSERCDCPLCTEHTQRLREFDAARQRQRPRLCIDQEIVIDRNLAPSYDFEAELVRRGFALWNVDDQAGVYIWRRTITQGADESEEDFRARAQREQNEFRQYSPPIVVETTPRNEAAIEEVAILMLRRGESPQTGLTSVAQWWGGLTSAQRNGYRVRARSDPQSPGYRSMEEAAIRAMSEGRPFETLTTAMRQWWDSLTSADRDRIRDLSGRRQ